MRTHYRVVVFVATMLAVTFFLVSRFFFHLGVATTEGEQQMGSKIVYQKCSVRKVDGRMLVKVIYAELPEGDFSIIAYCSTDPDGIFEPCAVGSGTDGHLGPYTLIASTPNGETFFYVTTIFKENSRPFWYVPEENE